MEKDASRKNVISTCLIWLGMEEKWAIYWGICLISLVILPYILPADWIHTSVEIIIMAIFATSLNLLLGYTGLIPFGQAAYFGAGAYTYAILALRTPLPFVVVFISSGIVAALLALIFGWFCVRLTQIYFAMLTLAFSELIFSIIFKWYSFTGGDNGLIGIPVPALLFDVRVYYLFCLFIFICFLVIFRVLLNSPFGVALQAIRENSLRAEAIGIKIKRHKLIAFIIAAFFSGLAGALMCCFNQSAFPIYAGWVKGAEPFLMSIVGGMYNFMGPTVGAVFMVVLEKIVITRTEYWPICMGFVLLVCVLFFREGAIEFFKHKILGAYKRIEKNGREQEASAN
jgi:branched-chain amino acid transport system permease protein